MITSSTYTEGAPQADGRRYVKEIHTDDAGRTYEYEWLGDQDASLVLQARAATLTQQIAAQRAAEALVAGTLLPLTKYQFRQLFTPTERAAIDAFEAGIETMQGIDEPTRAAIRTGFRDFNSALAVDRPFVPAVVQMLGLFQSLSLLTAARVAEIVSAGNG